MMSALRICGSLIPLDNIAYIGSNSGDKRKKYPTRIKFRSGESWGIPMSKDDVFQRYHEAAREDRQYEREYKRLVERCGELLDERTSLIRSVRAAVRLASENIVKAAAFATEQHARDYPMPEWLSDLAEAHGLQGNPLVLAYRRLKAKEPVT